MFRFRMPTKIPVSSDGEKNGCAPRKLPAPDPVPSREGGDQDGGEVSWLETEPLAFPGVASPSGSLSGPSGTEFRVSYSGGAAPDLNRTSEIPSVMRCRGLWIGAGGWGGKA